MTRKTLNKFNGNPSYFTTGYKPYYVTNEGVMGYKVQEKDIDLEKLRTLKLGATKGLREMDFEEDKPIYSALGSIVAACLTKEEEFAMMPLGKTKNHVTHDFMFGRQGKEVEICKLDSLDRHEYKHEEAQLGLLKLLLKDTLIKIKEDQVDLADEMGLVESKF